MAMNYSDRTIVDLLSEKDNLLDWNEYKPLVKRYVEIIKSECDKSGDYFIDSGLLNSKEHFRIHDMEYSSPNCVIDVFNVTTFVKVPIFITRKDIDEQSELYLLYNECTKKIIDNNLLRNG